MIITRIPYKTENVKKNVRNSITRHKLNSKFTDLLTKTLPEKRLDNHLKIYQKEKLRRIPRVKGRRNLCPAKPPIAPKTDFHSISKERKNN